MNITVGNTVFTARLADNSSAQALEERLRQGPMTLWMDDYAQMEKVGRLDTTFPVNDQTIQTEPGDIILYQGNQLTIYYDTNSWSLTRLGKIEGVSREELLEALGPGRVEVTFSLSE